MRSSVFRRGLRLGAFAIVTLTLAVSATLVFLCYSQAQIFAHPPRAAATVTPAAAGIDLWRDVNFAAADGVELRAWYLPPSMSPGAALVYVHGHGGNRAALAEMRFFADQGYGLLMLDLRNSGSSGGAATSLGYWEALDVEAAFAFLAAQPEVDAERIALYGVSMGGAAVIRAAADLPNVRALIVEATYVNMLDVVGDGVQRRTGLPPWPFANIILWLAGRESGADLFAVDSEAALASITVPILIMHGTNDETVSVAHAERLYAAANEPKQLWLLEVAGHGGLIFSDPAGYAARVTAFLDAYLRAVP
ncbi:MAG: alpha/beta fold hydrolase [Chloroflexi bacterium]|nr:alpha/beta fold hydrolase [Chloroflexota bacterium]